MRANGTNKPCRDLNEVVSGVQSKAEYALDLHAPWKEMKLSITERKPWYTNFLFNFRRDLWCLLRTQNQYKLCKIKK